MHTTYGMDTCIETNEILAFGRMEVYSRYIPGICKNLEYVRHIPDTCLTYDTIRIPDASRLYTGTLKRCPLQRSNFRRLKINLKSSGCDLLLDPIAKCAQECRAAGGCPPTLQTQYLVLHACSTRFKLVTRLLQVTTVTFSSDSS